MQYLKFNKKPGLTLDILNPNHPHILWTFFRLSYQLSRGEPYPYQ